VGEYISSIRNDGSVTLHGIWWSVVLIQQGGVQTVMHHGSYHIAVSVALCKVKYVQKFKLGCSGLFCR